MSHRSPGRSVRGAGTEGRTGKLRSRARWASMLSTAIAHGPLRNCQPGIPWTGSLYSTITQTPAAAPARLGCRGRRDRGCGCCKEARRLLTKWRRPWKRQPHFVPGRACQQTPTWPRLRNRRRRLVRVTERRGRRAEDFTALPLPRRDSRARALGEGEEGGERGREQ